MPQVTARHLERGLGELERPEVDAAFGPAPDGGYWRSVCDNPTHANADEHF